MAKKPKANNQNNMVRNVIIIFAAIILVAGTLIVWNNRDMSFAGTVDGQRIPMSHLNFFWNSWGDNEGLMWEMLQHGIMPGSPEANEFIMELAWNSVVEQTIVASHAEDMGITLAGENAEMVDEQIETFENWFTHVNEEGEVLVTSSEMIRALGFSNASFRRFAEQVVLAGLVHDHIVASVELGDEELAEAFAEHLEEHFDYSDVFVHIIEVDTEELANELWMQIALGADFLGLMREYSLAYNTDMLEEDEEGNLIEDLHILATNLRTNQDHIEMAHDMGIGDVSSIITLDNNNFAIFEVVRIEHLDDEGRAELEEEFNAWHTSVVSNEHFSNQVMIWLEQADVRQNSRVFN